MNFESETTLSLSKYRLFGRQHSHWGGTLQKLLVYIINVLRKSILIVCVSLMLSLSICLSVKSFCQLVSWSFGSDRQMERKLDRQKNGQTGGQTDKRINRWLDRKTDEKTEKRMDRQTERRMDRRMGRQSDRQTDSRAVRQSDRQTD